MKIKTSFLVILILILSNPLSYAIADTNIYKYVDKDGNITFTNRRINNAQKISIASFSRGAEPSNVRSKSSQVRTVSQIERDTMRRQILEKELAVEENLFTETQNSLAQMNSNTNVNSPPEKSVQLKNKLFLHQRNISALKKELSKL